MQSNFDEECDEGAENQKTSDPKLALGGCMANCKRDGRCGDGALSGPETCDDGVSDGAYGGRTPQCKPAPHCGDSIVNGKEKCNDGADNARDGRCSTTCKTIIYSRP